MTVYEVIATDAAETDLVDTDTDTDTDTEADTEAETDVTDTGGRVRRAAHWLAARWRMFVVVGLLLSSAVWVAVLYFTQHRIDRHTDAASIQEVVDAASTGTAALLSYAPQTLDKDLADARSIMTGDFMTYYGKFTSDVVAPAVRDKGIKATAQIVRAGMMEIHPASAKVLVFLNQETVSTQRPDPSLTASSVVVSLTKIDGSWLISAFDPV